MFRLAFRQLQLDPIRTFLTAIELASVIAVVLILEGFKAGQYYQLEQIVINRKSDLIVTQSGVRNFIAVRSSIPQTVRSDIEEIEGVKSAHPMTAIPIVHNVDNVLTPVYVLVHDTGGGPFDIIEGKGIENINEIVIADSLAKKYGIKPGDDFIISDFKFTVSGITREAAFMMPFAFISYDGMIDLYLESDIAPDLSTFPMLSYLLLDLEESADLNTVAASIEALIPSVDVYTPEQVAARDVNMGKTFFEPIIGLLVFVAYVIGLMVVALILYSDVRSRMKSFAVLKAIGFPFKKLINAVFFQAVLLLALALPIGVLLAQFITNIIHSEAPLYLIRFLEASILAKTLLASYLFAIIGSFIPLRLIQKSDPAIAFEGV